MADRYNESKFLHYFLNYYLNIVHVNHIFVYDNQSTDMSQEIVKSYNNTTLIEYDTNNQIRDDVYLQIKNHEWKKYSRGKSVDFVFIVDIDEILYHPTTGGLRGYLQQLRDTMHSSFDIIKPTGYQMYAPDFRETFTYDPLELSCVGKPDDDFSKLAIFNPDRIIDINYFAGCHKCDPISTRSSPVVTLFNTGVKLLHYKYVYGVDYLIERYKLYQRRLSDINKVHGWGKHYLQKIEDIKIQYADAEKDVVSVIDN